MNILDIFPFDIIRMIATYLGDVDHCRFRHVCKTTTRLPPRRMEIEIKLRSCARSLIENHSLPFDELKIMEFDKCYVAYSKRKNTYRVSHTFEFAIQKRRAKIIIRGNKYCSDYYVYSFCGERRGIYVNYIGEMKKLRIDIMENDDYIMVTEVPFRELLNVRKFPSFKDYNIHLWNIVKNTEFGQRNMSLFQEILN